MAEQSAADAVTTRKIAEQLFDVWEAKRGPKSSLRGSLPAWAAVVLSIIAVIYQVGIANARIEANSAELAIHARDLREQSQDAAAAAASMARIETKLDLLMSERGLGSER